MRPPSLGPLLLHCSQRFAHSAPGECLLAWQMCLVPYRREGRVEEDFNGRWESMDLHCSLAMFLWFKELRGSGATASVP